MFCLLTFKMVFVILASMKQLFHTMFSFSDASGKVILHVFNVEFLALSFHYLSTFLVTKSYLIQLIIYNLPF
jgi:hypothetical protein